jgi:hypothetical protein
MRFHLLKPLHGWRAFAGEVGIIVVGVMIALGAQQGVEYFSWQKNVRDAKKDLSTELEGDLFAAQERMLMKACIDLRLDQLSELIDDPPAKPWSLLGGSSVTTLRVWSSSAWDTAVADGTVAHMSSDERAKYANVYSYVRGLHALVLEEYPVVVEFRMLEHGGPLTDVSQDRMRSDVARVRGYNQILDIGAKWVSREIEELGVGLGPDYTKRLASLKCSLPRDTLPANLRG